MSDKLRRAFFALWRKLGGDAALGDRHAWAAANGYPQSTKNWSAKDWTSAVAALQAATGRPGVQPGKPHLRASCNRQSAIGSRQSPLPAILTCAATPEQVAYINDLAAQIHWDRPDGLTRVIRRIILREPPPGQVASRWGGTLNTLDRRKASAVIRLLKRMVAAQYCPACGSERYRRDPDTDRRTCAACGHFGRRRPRRNPVGATHASPLARGADPQTSADAAERVSGDGTVDSHELRIITVLRLERAGLTGREIAAAIRYRYQTPCDHVQVMRRMAALITAGQVHRLRDRHGNLCRRDRQAIHRIGRGDMRLWGE